MKYLLIGCNGKMGKSITKLASNFKDEIECGIDLLQTETTFPVYNSIENISGSFDAVIDFSSQDSHVQYINYAKRMRLPYAIFSTNIDDKTNEAIIDASNKIPILKCSNSSAGANTMFELTQICCKNLKDAETVLTEYHHKNKKDAPSGTAKTLLNIIFI